MIECASEGPLLLLLLLRSKNEKKEEKRLDTILAAMAAAAERPRRFQRDGRVRMSRMSQLIPSSKSVGGSFITLLTDI